MPGGEGAQPPPEHPAVGLGRLRRPGAAGQAAAEVLVPVEERQAESPSAGDAATAGDGGAGDGYIPWQTGRQTVMQVTRKGRN